MEEKGQIGEVEKITCREVLRLVLFFCFIVAFFPPFIFRFSYFFFFLSQVILCGHSLM